MALYLWPLLLGAAPPLQDLPTGPALEPGRVVFDQVAPDGPTLAGRGPAKRFTIEVEADGPMTLTAQSYDFDAFLRVVDSDGRLLAEDDNDGFETNPRIVVSLKAGSYGVIVAAPRDRSGSFEVRAERGETPPLVGLALDIARTGFLQQSLERAIDRGDEHEAGRIGVRLGSALHATRQCLVAQTVLRAARERLAAADDALGTARADLELGRILLVLGRYPGAAEQFERALQGFRGIDERADEVAALLGLGDVRVKRSELDLAEQHYLEALEIADRLAEPSLRAYALARQGTLALTSGELERARELLEARRETVRKIGDRLREANANTDLARLELTGRGCAAAIELLDEALLTYRELGAAQGEAQALLELGRAQVECGQVDTARETLESALTIAREKELAELEVVTLHNLGTYWEDRRRIDLALELYQDALGKAEILELSGEVRQLIGLTGWILSESDPQRAIEQRPRLLATLADAQAAGDLSPSATILKALAWLDRQTGNLREAALHAEQALEVYDRLGWDDAAIRVQLAWIHYDSGDAAGAEQLFREVEATGSSLSSIAEMLVCEGLGRMHFERGEYYDAYVRYERRLELARGLGLLDEEANAHRDMGSLATQMGNATRALEHLEQARAFASEQGTVNPLEIIGTHIEFGRAYTVAREYDKAEGEYAEARRIGEETGQPVAALFGLEGIAYVRLMREDYLESLELHREALDAARSFGLEQHIPVLLGNLSAVYLGLESFVAARRHAEEALAAAEAQPVWDPTYTLEPLHTLASLSRSEGLAQEGFALLDQAYERIGELRAQATRAGLGFGPDASYWSQRFDRVYQDLSRQRERDLGRPATEDDLSDAFQRTDASRARDLLSGLVQLERGARSREAERRWSELDELYDKWVGLVAERRNLLRTGEGDTSGLKRQSDAVKRQIEALEAALAQISPRDAALIASTGSSPSALRETALAPGRVLMLFAEGELDMYAYVLTLDSLSVHKLGSRSSLKERAERFATMLGDRRALGTAADIAALGSELYRDLCARPLGELADGLEHLIVVPTPELAQIPFGALVTETTNEGQSFDDVAFLADRSMVTYGPAGSVLLRLAERGPHKRDGKMLVLADPTYGSDGAVEAASGREPVTRSARELGQLPRLVQSRHEAFAVAEPVVRGSEPGALSRLDELRAERSGSLQGAAIDLFVGSDASADKLLKEPLRDYSWIHLAVHGRVDLDDSNDSCVVLASDPQGEARVTLEDILGLELDADVVVLSACETARHSDFAGEGIESMASAFLAAGARGVVASLWQVDDAITADTMTAFYDGVLKTESATADALHTAQINVREAVGSQTTRDGSGTDPLAVDPRHPYFWAAFVHIGLPTR